MHTSVFCLALLHTIASVLVDTSPDVAVVALRPAGDEGKKVVQAVELQRARLGDKILSREAALQRLFGQSGTVDVESSALAALVNRARDHEANFDTAAANALRLRVENAFNHGSRLDVAVLDAAQRVCLDTVAGLVGEGLETRAVAKARECARRFPDAPVDPLRYPPVVGDLLAAAKRHVQALATVEVQVETGDGAGGRVYADGIFLGPTGRRLAARLVKGRYRFWVSGLGPSLPQTIEISQPSKEPMVLTPRLDAMLTLAPTLVLACGDDCPRALGVLARRLGVSTIYAVNVPAAPKGTFTALRYSASTNDVAEWVVTLEPPPLTVAVAPFVTSDKSEAAWGYVMADAICSRLYGHPKIDFKSRTTHMPPDLIDWRQVAGVTDREQWLPRSPAAAAAVLAAVDADVLIYGSYTLVQDSLTVRWSATGMGRSEHGQAKLAVAMLTELPAMILAPIEKRFEAAGMLSGHRWPALTPKAALAFGTGLQYLNPGRAGPLASDVERASVALHETARLVPSFPRVWTELGRAKSLQKDFEAAESHFAKALSLMSELEPTLAEALYVLYLGRGEGTFAIDVLQRSVKSHPGFIRGRRLLQRSPR